MDFIHFGRRMEIERLYLKWCEEGGIANEPNSFVVFLMSKGWLNIRKIIADLEGRETELSFKVDEIGDDDPTIHAIAYLQKVGWLQEHDRALTESRTCETCKFEWFEPECDSCDDTYSNWQPKAGPQTSGVVWTEDAIRNEPTSYTTWTSTDESQMEYKKRDIPLKVGLPTGEITTCVSVLASAFQQLAANDFFREPTTEERKAVADYIDSISVPTGVNVFDLMDEAANEKEESK